MMMLLMSDIVPLLFLLLSSSDRSLALYGMVFSRAFSLLFHTFAETMPFLINLDCIGIACMAFASLDACEAVGCAGLSSYRFVLLSVFCVTCAVFLHDLFRRKPTSRQELIMALACLGQYPAAFALCTGHSHAPLLCCATFAFSFGYIVIEPRSHIAWHWAAALGQACILFVLQITPRFP